jgi:hypothetical protein
VIALPPGLSQGVYQVNYLSNAEDGAKLEGAFAFGVGAAVPASMAKTEVEVVEEHEHGPTEPAHLPRTGGAPLELLVGLAGDWRVEVRVRRETAEDVSTVFTVPFAPAPVEGRPALCSRLCGTGDGAALLK